MLRVGVSEGRAGSKFAFVGKTTTFLAILFNHFSH